MALFDDIFKIKTQTSTGLFSASNPWRAASKPEVSVAPSEKGLAPIKGPEVGRSTKTGRAREGSAGVKGKRKSDGLSQDGNSLKIGLPKKKKKKSKGSEAPLPSEVLPFFRYASLPLPTPGHCCGEH
jgi:hypothetical protein